MFETDKVERRIAKLEQVAEPKGSGDTFSDSSVPPVEAVHQIHWLARNGSDCFETFEFLMRQDALYRDAPKQTLFQLYDRYKSVPIDGCELNAESNGDENNCNRLPEGFKEGEF